MRILGIDPSLSNTGFALLRFYNNNLELLEVTHLKALPSSKKVKGEKIIYTIQERIYNFYIELNKLLDDFLPDYIMIEEPVVFRNSKGVIYVSYLVGMIITLSSYFVGSDSVILLNPSTVKKVITGKGNADKELIKKSLEQNYKFDLNNFDSDEIDAIGIAITGFNQFLKIKGSK